jgi:hypothetical protein
MAAASQLQAQATLSVQGTIQRSFGGAVDDGKYALTFKLYTAETGGTPVWSETQDNIEVIGGVYSALLGEANPLTAGFNEVYYLGIAVDGGAELIPRTRLTSAPYALSLIGQSNTFPSAGNVGVGTVTPEAGQNLHVHNASGPAQMLVSSASVDDPTIINLSSGNNSAAIAVEGGNGNFNIVNSNGHINLSAKGATRAYTDDYGFRVNGRQDIFADAAVPNPFISFNAGGYYSHITQFNSGTFNIYSPGSANYISGGRIHIHGDGGLKAHTDGDGFVINGRLHATWFVTATGYQINSDARIKKNINLTNNSNDLNTLMKLQVTDYTYVDTLFKGKERVKGFIAQQVENVYAPAVSKSTGFLPDILADVSSVEVSGKDATIYLTKSHSLSAGDVVKLIIAGVPKELPVVQIIDSNTFRVGNWEDGLDTKDVLVYGKQVSDFRSVDYDRIYTLNVSATQELARRVAELEAANAGLMEKNNKLQQQNEGLRGDVNGLSDRLTKLENLLMSSGKR